ncbi:proline dehydrogenase family protein [Denitratisoma oestradiolicum]|uniref:L-glutamate gamma-semialdehyde dehydrogenase n=1 Tax=Denitratisoma oestradiolicum TaxID=311182 RepID=A0A6S6XZ62_9PROT|nr:proline dehydrogenase family protein [Denitratisoma oestradiolicum]TWO79060.1 hypothetical protein CBW56_16675 [Denitratisoma oestradiolicum]CAB1368189.1 conserved protein of unknown function [Denitratisoma oestradiolicum]
MDDRRTVGVGITEAEIMDIGLALHCRAASSTPRLYRGLLGRLLRRTMEDEGVRHALFQFIDTLPRLSRGRDIGAHLGAYLDQAGAAGWPRALLRLGEQPLLAPLVKWQTGRWGRQLLCPENARALGRVIGALAPARTSFDAVGEAVLTEAEADAYLARNLALLEWQAAAGVTPHLSLKLTALSPRCDPLDPAGSRRAVFSRLEPLMAAVERHGAGLTVDMEQHELKPLLQDLFLAMLEAWPGERWQPAIALQAYGPDAESDLSRLLAAGQRQGRRIGVRLVKGAYWDQERAWAAQRGWSAPVFADKAATDACFENLTGELLRRHDSLYPAIASHNLRSQAVALAWVRHLGLAPECWEVQMLYGMGEPLRDALAAEGVPLRIYVPTGDLIGGMAYLIRRLLENTAQESVLRQTYVAGADATQLLSPPRLAAKEASTVAAPGFANAPLLDFSRPEPVAAMVQALAELRAGPELEIAPDTPVHEVRNPAAPEQVLARFPLADPAQGEAAVARALAAFAGWRATPAAQRATCLRRAAAAMLAERHHLAALMVLSVGKNWREADGDVAEAVDFLNYYADAMEALAGWWDTISFPGEANRLGYEPRGPALVIAPWNFPLAILTGMAAAALVAGNPVILKPSRPGLLLGQALHRLLLEAGVPADACQLLPATGAVTEALAGHPDIAIIAFTGSRETGLGLLQAAHRPVPGQYQIKQVVCELGGKNAIVVDSDADLDEAVPAIVASAFGYQGQKCSACSRLIVVGDEAAAEAVARRVADALAVWSWGPPEDPAQVFGPMISAEARDKTLEYIAIGRQEGRLLYQGAVPGEGWYAPPCIFTGIQPHHRLAREEIFGPVLAVLAAPDFPAALKLAQAVDYGLTGGVFSRLPAHLALAAREFRVGDLYLNRKITGARVGAQPFGGTRLSGTGIQAGGPDYLKQFLWTRVVSENTQRHGYIGARSTLDSGEASWT